MAKQSERFPWREFEVLEEWAVRRMHEGDDPPWVWYRLMQLRDAIDGCKRSYGVVSQTEADLQELMERQDISPPQQGEVVQLKTSRRRRDIPPIDLPM